MSDAMLARAEGCLLGQFAGDALGSRVEFMTAAEILDHFPAGVREMGVSVWQTLPGQLTDDSEMALMLAGSIAERGSYDPSQALVAYQFWLKSEPFDIGMTTRRGLRGNPNLESQANGALMRVSPLGIFCAALHPRDRLKHAAMFAMQDATLTHPNTVCLEANALYTMAIAEAVATGKPAEELYENVCRWASETQTDPIIMTAIRDAADFPSRDADGPQQGWVVLALQNALWQLLHASGPEEGIVSSIMAGGDTDTTAAIAGALLGAVYGRDRIPNRWTEALLCCRPALGAPGVERPRPECFWPVRVLEISQSLLQAGQAFCSSRGQS